MLAEFALNGRKKLLGYGFSADLFGYALSFFYFRDFAAEFPVVEELQESYLQALCHSRERQENR